MREKFGQDSEVYACGFSLGSNYLLRYLGTQEGANCGIKAAFSVSSAFCCNTASVQLKHQTFGIYDSYIQSKIAGPFLQHRYKV